MTICPSCGHENNETAKFCEECAAPLVAEAPSREQRKTVTVLFCDVTGSTALRRVDRPGGAPRAARALLRAHEGHRRVARRHVEKFIGDAVMAVFGVPRCTRTTRYGRCRAAVEMRDALPGARASQARIGVNTGEVVTGTEERLATGDAVNVAARLEQAAQPGEILIGAETLALVRDAVEVEPVEPLELKGKAEPSPPTVSSPCTGDLSARTRRRMVGRETELAQPARRVRPGRRRPLVPALHVLGRRRGQVAPRHEFLDALDATVVRGRCLSYGEGITYWPVVEVLKQLGAPARRRGGGDRRSARSWASRRPTTSRRDRLGVPQAARAGGGRAPARRASSTTSTGREPTLLDLIEHIADLSRDAPILLLCMARPGAARPPTGLGRRQDQRHHRAARAAVARRDASS